MIASATPVPLIESLAAIADRYDAVICDVWGVLHNGVRVSRPANDALIALRERGKAVVMLTNAPRPAAAIEALAFKLGADARGWNAVVSSGGVTRAILEQHGARPFLHMGPQRDISLYEGLAARPTGLDAADYVLCTGLLDDETETAETYRPQLEAMLARRMEMICANPDMVVERGHRLVPCAGAIADLYEHMGGPVTWVGKPHPLVYDFALAEIERVLGRKVERSRLLGIGDAMRTDVAGAAAFGIESLFVIDGIHAAEAGVSDGVLPPGKLDAFMAKHTQRPTWATRSLQP